MSKALIVLIVGMLAVGCATLTPEEKALRDSVVGEYAYDDGGAGNRVVLLDSDDEWSIVDGEIHLEGMAREQNVYRINPDKSITFVAIIRNGKRIDLQKEEPLDFAGQAKRLQETFKKIK